MRKIENENKLANIIEKVIVILLGCILLILPFPRGLFFEKEIIPVQFIIYIIFVLWTVYKIIKKEKLLINSYLTISVCIITIAYMLPVFFNYSANKTDAINYVLRYGAYLLLFIMASDLTKTKEQLKIWLYFLVISGLCAGLLGIDSLAGGQIGPNIERFFEKSMNFKLGFDSIGFQYNRLYGVLQYANTAGVYYAMIFFMLIAISILSTQKFIKIICSGLMFIMLTTLMLTLSRGAIILVPVIYLALLILLPEKDKKIEFILITIAPAILTLILYQPLQLASPIITPDAGTLSKVWMLTIVGTLITSVITFVLLLFTNSLNKVSEKTYNVVFIVIMVLVVISIIIIFATGLYKKIIPQELLDRFLQTGSQATSGRTDFYRDGLRVLKDTWLFGAGGGAWNALYRAYQSYDYASTEAHNLFLQVWIEAGLIGILGYIFMLLSALKTYIDCRKKKANADMCILLLAIIIYTIGHSMIDFDFSYFSIPVIIFFLLGTLNGINQEIYKNNIINFKTPVKYNGPSFKISPWIGTIIGCSFAFIAGSFIIARIYAVNATTIVMNKQLTAEHLMKAEEQMRKAISFNPWNIDFYIMESAPKNTDLQLNLNKLYELAWQLDPTNEGLAQLHYNAIMNAVKLSPKNPIINVMAAQFMLNRAGQIEEGLKYMDKGLKYNPMAYGRYEETANAYYEVGKFFYEQGNQKEAEIYLTRVIQIENEIQEINKRAIQPVNINENTLNYINQAKELLG